MKHTKTKILSALSILALSATTHAATVSLDVYAQANSSSGGTALDTGLFFNAGETISGWVAEDDLWNAGALPRWSNADGLITDLFATGTDDSGETAGTQIGKEFSLYTQNGFTAAYGTLVGQIGNEYFSLGTSFDAVTSTSGNLKLMYWDSNNGDNTEFVTVNFTSPVPEPSTLALFALGTIGLVGFTRLRNRQR